MGLGDWAKKHLAVRFDSHTLGNLLKNGAPAAGLMGGPGGIALAGGLSAVGDLARGKKVSVGNAITNASLAAGVGGLKHALTTPGAPPPVPGGPTASTNGSWLPGVGQAGQAAPVPPTSFLDRAGDVGGKVLSFADKHPTAAAAGLNAVGHLSTAGAQNRIANAQADLLEQQAGETAYDFEQRKLRKQMLAPTWSALSQAAAGNTGHVAANPYLPGD